MSDRQYLIADRRWRCTDCRAIFNSVHQAMLHTIRIGGGGWGHMGFDTPEVQK